MAKINVLLLCGGVSPEHEVSMNSARNIYKAIDKDKYRVAVVGVDRNGRWYHLDAKRFMTMKVAEGKKSRMLGLSPGGKRIFFYQHCDDKFPKIDVVFPIIHGPFGEDGTLQGMLSLLGLPFVGPGTLGSSVGMDKDFTKRLLRDAGIAVAPWETLRQHERDHLNLKKLEQKLGYPMFVKPANMGSSVGVSKAENRKQLLIAIDEAFRFDTKILVEKGIKGREIETAVLGNAEDAQVSGVGEIVMAHGFYDYDSKYILEDAAKIIIPAEVKAHDRDNIRQTALRAYHALGLEGLARVDVFLAANGTVFVNEPNTLPGFTNISMYPKLWQQEGIAYADLLDRLIGFAIARHRRDSELNRTRG